MRLRNKKTREIGYLISTNWNEESLKVVDNNGVQLGKYTSLAELNEEWEDYEEPKMFYWVDYDGKICKAEIGTMDRTKIKQIGNYFETKEEAEKAVEKLKAWKRLKDKGFRFTNWEKNENYPGDITIEAVDVFTTAPADLDLLFSGGEE